MALANDLWDGVNVLAWNCYGMNGKEAPQHLYELKRQRNLKMIFFSETKLKKGGAEQHRIAMRMAGCLEVSARGHSGGLALFLDSDVKLTICSYSQNYIDAVIECAQGEWCFTGIYGFPEAGRKLLTFRLLDYLRNHIHNHDRLVRVRSRIFPGVLWEILIALFRMMRSRVACRI